MLQRAGLPSDSHDGKALAHILDTYPRDEMFQVNEDELFATALGILRLGERPKVRVFLRFDRFDRFVSAFVFVPRDRYNTDVREKIHAILAKAFHGRPSASDPTIDDSLLARIHYIIGRNDGPRPEVDIAGLEAQIREAIRTWDDGFSEALMKSTRRRRRRTPFPPLRQRVSRRAIATSFRPMKRCAILKNWRRCRIARRTRSRRAPIARTATNAASCG